AAPGRQQIGEGAEGQVASAPPAPKAGEVFPVANTSAVDALPAQGVREHSASRPGEGMGLLQAPAITPAASAQPVQAVDAKHVGAEDRTGVWAVRQARQAGGEALYNVCIILNAPSAAGREARIDPAGARQADDKDDDGNGETPSRE
ncbi:MAG: hypothetical protein NT031_18185, partial [Planctomycetota bacterium]|nr:hypothetical protein [Planctomycetota bacterium]